MNDLNDWTELPAKGENDYFLGRSLDVFISKIRKYLNEDPDLNIENVFGVGFIFNVPEKY